MPKGPRLSDYDKDIIAQIYNRNRGSKAEVIRHLASQRLHREIGLSTIQRELANFRANKRRVSTDPIDDQWTLATDGLENALKAYGRPFVINEGDGAFYGPKIDIHIKDALGRTWQCGTVQLDMSLPERFDLTYIGKDNERHRPIMIHRVIYGSIERAEDAGSSSTARRASPRACSLSPSF